MQEIRETILRLLWSFMVSLQGRSHKKIISEAVFIVLLSNLKKQTKRNENQWVRQCLCLPVTIYGPGLGLWGISIFVTILLVRTKNHDLWAGPIRSSRFMDFPSYIANLIGYTNTLRMLRKWGPARGRDSWWWPKWPPLMGTRMCIF